MMYPNVTVQIIRNDRIISNLRRGQRYFNVRLIYSILWIKEDPITFFFFL